jgi:hypothetical protein
MLRAIREKTAKIAILAEKYNPLSQQLPIKSFCHIKNRLYT